MKNVTPKVSVIIPVYNVENYLEQCLDSILNQTYRNLEIIVVDDGSTDRSGEICDAYTLRHSNLKVIHKENAGLGMARNTGLEYISGEYVTFLDSDDWLEPDMIQQLYNGIVSQNVDVCKAGFRRVTNEKEVLFERSYQDEYFPGEYARLELLPRMIGSSPSQHDSVEMCVCAVLYRAALIKQHALRFPSERELISEDLVFNIDYMQFADGACTISYSGYNYRMNMGSLSTSYHPDRFQACCYFYSEMKKKILDLGYENATLLRLQRMFFIHVRMSISQERLSVSKLTVVQGISNIRKICKDPVLIGAIAEYPVHRLEWKQALFLRLIRSNCAGLLLLLACLGFF